jgi:hypothetical protein
VIIGAGDGDVAQDGGEGLGPLVNVMGVAAAKNAGDCFPCII